MMYTPSNTDSVRTPENLLNYLQEHYGESWYDPCEFNPKFNSDTHVDGLKTDWKALCKDFVYVNPPYSSSKKWILKSNDYPDLTIIYLLKNGTLGSSYYNQLEGPSNLVFINPHIQFPGYKKKARFSSFLLIRGPLANNTFKFLKLS